AVLLGGTSLSGGVDTIWGSLAGLLLIGALENMMRILDVPAYWQRILQGGLLLAIVVADRLGDKRIARRLPIFANLAKTDRNKGDLRAEEWQASFRRRGDGGRRRLPRRIPPVGCSR